VEKEDEEMGMLSDVFEKISSLWRKNSNPIRVNNYPDPYGPADISVLTVVIDGEDAVITTGVKADILVPYDCLITQATLLADLTGSISVDVWVCSYDDYPPTNSDSKTTPAIVAGMSFQNLALSIRVPRNSVVRVNVDSCETITRCLLALTLDKDD